MGEQSLNFVVVRMIWISHNFLVYLQNFDWGFFVLNKHRFKLIFVEIFKWFEILLYFVVFLLLPFCCRDKFIQRLLNNTGRPLSLILIVSPELPIYFQSYIRWPVIGCIESYLQSLESHFFYVLTVDSYEPLRLSQYQSFFRPMTASFSIIVHVYV